MGLTNILIQELQYTTITICFPAIQQIYKSGVEYEDVILGNDALLKCKIPSFVTDFVEVISWQEVGSGDEFYAQSQQSRLGKEHRGL